MRRDTLYRYEALRANQTDIVLGAIELDPSRSNCSSACPPPGPIVDDYSDLSALAASFAGICCLDYSVQCPALWVLAPRPTLG